MSKFMESDSGSSRHNRDKKVLIVDDEEDTRTTISLILQGLGFETIEAEDGTSAFSSARLHKPDLIISDVMMDNGNGFMLRELLKGESSVDSTPMILMTGAAQEAGAWTSDSSILYLKKPFTTEALISAVKKRLNG